LAKLNLGLTPWDFSDLSAISLVRQARLAENLGYDSVWLPENHFGQNAIPDPITLLAAVAGGTSKIRLGTTSYLLTLRNPLQAAEQVAVLDQLSHGRVILGVGRGYAPDMLKAFHVPPAQKRRIFSWALDIMQDAWSGKPVTLDENEENAVLVHPLPFQKPWPPIWVAAFGPKALAQAGKLGLPYLCSPMESMEKLKENFDVHRNEIESAGLEVPETVPLMRSVFISKDSKAVKAIKREVEEKTENTRLKDSDTIDDWVIIGEPKEVRDMLDQYIEQLGMNYLIASRVRASGIDSKVLEESMALLAEISE
jgi:alkanesulfonate monooxygenase SsuD/methylene tetrahydromethanopterin reductase-like flavin-dependent oxidoreductase (luciferase family)